MSKPVHRSAVAHAKACAWARAKVADPATLVLDSETCGKEHDAGLVDLAIVTIAGDVLFDSLIHPGHPIPPDSTAVHGIGDGAVADAPRWAAIYPAVAGLLSGRTVLAYNSAFDAGVIAAECAMAGLPPIEANWECAMKSFSDWEGAPGKYPGSFRWWRLDDAAAKFGIKPGGHRALQDAQTARLVVLAMAAAGVAAPELAKPEAMAQGALFSTTDAGRFTR